MKQKFLTLLLAVFMMVAALSMNSEAAETEESPVLERMEAFTEASVFAAAEEQWEIYDAGYCHDNVVWGITPDGILIITTENSRGTMPDYSSQSAPWDIYEEYICFVIIDGTIDNVSAKAFDDFDSLEYVYLYDGVKKIGERAFVCCDSLTEINIPDSVTTIGNDAFYYNRSLKEITLPKNLTSIGEDSFARSSLKTVTIPGGVKRIGVEAFSICFNTANLPYLCNSSFISLAISHLTIFTLALGSLLNTSLAPFIPGSSLSNHIIISSKPGIGDVSILQTDGSTLFIESKKFKSGSGGEYPAMREAIGQLMTGCPDRPDVIPVVAVPYSPKSDELAQKWSSNKRMHMAGIRFMLVHENGDIDFI